MSESEDFLRMRSEVISLLKKQQGEDQEKIKAMLDKMATSFLQKQEQTDILNARLDEAKRESGKNKNAIQDFDRVKNDFLSICAHDLKSPISSMLSFLDILKDDWQQMPPQERLGIMSRMERAGRHSLSLISDLLDTVQYESGKFNIKPEAVLLSQLCKETVSHTQGNLNNKEITCKFTTHGSELKVKMDPQKGIQIINNLLSNAIKFTPRGGNIEIVLSHKEKRMYLEIKDSGQGIPEDEIHVLFQRFQKTSTSSTEGEKGSGLGLNIVKQLVDLHQGTIDVKSELGIGTSFILSFPVTESTMLLKLFSGRKA
ncbi:MAG: HAMP domain-containing histidine kinase [Planctomycetes bacterium]|nr:HAMP domain-containing histidine kinase [Planctomycetota bacterium]